MNRQLVRGHFESCGGGGGEVGFSWTQIYINHGIDLMLPSAAPGKMSQNGLEYHNIKTSQQHNIKTSCRRKSAMRNSRPGDCVSSHPRAQVVGVGHRRLSQSTSQLLQG